VPDELIHSQSKIVYILLEFTDSEDQIQWGNLLKSPKTAPIYSWGWFFLVFFPIPIRARCLVWVPKVIEACPGAMQSNQAPKPVGQYWARGITKKKIPIPWTLTLPWGKALLFDTQAIFSYTHLRSQGRNEWLNPVRVSENEGLRILSHASCAISRCVHYSRS